MLFKISDVRVEKIRNKIFPTLQTKIKSVVINDAGSDNPDNILNISVICTDGQKDANTNENIFRVFNNKFAKKYLKLKVFEINSTAMSREIEILSQKTKFGIQEIENIINNYGAESRDLSTAYDFIGDKTNINAHNISSDGSIELNYNIKFILRRPVIEYLDIAYAYYIDEDAYLQDNRVEDRFINQKLFNSRFVVAKIIRNNNLDINYALAPSVTDLRLFKSVFQKNNYFESVLDLIDSDKLYQNLRSSNKLLSTRTIDSLNTQKELNPLAIYNRKISNVFYSKNSDYSIGMTFSIDYESIIKDNSPYKNILKSQRFEIKQTLFEKCKISSMDLFRRQVKKEYNKHIPLHDTTTRIISSNEISNFSGLLSKADSNGNFIGEIELKTGIDNRLFYIKNFAAKDKQLFLNDKTEVNGLYQYGLKINIVDGITSYINEQITTGSFHAKNLRSYLEETNKLVTTIVDQENKIILKGSYDPQTNSFTKKFIDDFNNQISPYYKFINDAAYHFVYLLEMIGLFSQSQLEQKFYIEAMLNSIISSLDPNRTSAETISYFIKIYDKLLSNLARATKENYNNSYTIEHWFTNDYVDLSTSIKQGYKFVNFQLYNGLGVINTSEHFSRVVEEVSRYTSNTSIIDPLFEENKFSYLSPNKVISANKELNFENLNNNPNGISNMDFIELEIDIKKSYFSTNTKANNVTSFFGDPERDKKGLLKQKLNSLAIPASLKINNSFLSLDDSNAVTSTELERANERVDETNLILGLIKGFDFHKLKYNNVINTTDNYVSYNSLSQEEKNNLPIQIFLLLEDRTSLLLLSNDYRKSLEYNSKFHFLFNTLHKLEVLEYDSNTFSEKWSAVTKQKIQDLEIGNYLFRITNYKNSSAGIEGLDKINLPVYEKYFFYQKTDFELPVPVQPVTITPVAPPQPILLIPQELPPLKELDKTIIDRILEDLNGPVYIPTFNDVYERELTDFIIKDLKDTAVDLGVDLTLTPEFDIQAFAFPDLNLNITKTELVNTKFGETIDLSGLEPKIPSRSLFESADLDMTDQTKTFSSFFPDSTDLSLTGDLKTTLTEAELVTQKVADFSGVDYTATLAGEIEATTAFKTAATTTTLTTDTTTLNTATTTFTADTTTLKTATTTTYKTGTTYQSFQQPYVYPFG